MSYNYPGNVRELRNIVEYAINICRDRQIKPEHLPSYLMEAGPDDMAAVAQVPPTRLAFKTEESGFARPEPHQSWPAIEKRMITEALIKAGGRKNKAAVSLGWARSTLWRKIKQYGIG